MNTYTRVEKLAENLLDQSLESLKDMEEAIKLVRIRKGEMKREAVPPEDVEVLRAAWKLCQHKQRIRLNIPVEFEVSADGSDPCGVYPSVVSPEYMQDWDAYELATLYDTEHDQGIRKALDQAVESLQGRLKHANDIHREFERLNDMPASDFLE